MTEKELFAAIHEYGAVYVDSYSHAPVAAARAKLLAAIRQFSVEDFVTEHSLKMLAAKVAVCDSILADEVYVAHGSIETRNAIARLREMQEKAP